MPSGPSVSAIETASRAVSPGARNRGSDTSGNTGSRIVVPAVAEPTPVGDQAVAISRSLPSKSGTGSATVPRPCASSSTSPENSDTTRVLVTASPVGPDPSSPPSRMRPTRARPSSSCP